MYSTDQYDYDLPADRIAQHPASPRDHSRLLVLDRRKGAWEHRRFTDLPDYLDGRDVLVANNTQVLKARLLGRRILDAKSGLRLGGEVEFLLLEERERGVWEGLFRASVGPKAGVRFEIPAPSGGPIQGEIVRPGSESPTGTVWARFDRDPVAAGAGEVPLPPYISRSASTPRDQRALDEERYQTIYGKHLGSAAAPTAGLHFTPSVLEAIRARGAHWEELTLHVGLGTFRPVKTGDVREHVMHEERYEIPDSVARSLMSARVDGRRIVAVGTTSVRALESAWDGERFRAGMGRTSVFFYPGGPGAIRVVDRLITNFHLPRSTLLMLVCAFAGRDLVLEAYRDAVRMKYRFFSYGDAMLVV